MGVSEVRIERPRPPRRAFRFRTIVAIYWIDMDVPVYSEWMAEDVPSSHGDGIAYHVFVGTVNWLWFGDGLFRAFLEFSQQFITRHARDLCAFIPGRRSQCN
jgi:hypothetical protein